MFSEGARRFVGSDGRHLCDCDCMAGNTQMMGYVVKTNIIHIASLKFYALTIPASINRKAGSSTSLSTPRIQLSARLKSGGEVGFAGRDFRGGSGENRALEPFLVFPRGTFDIAARYRGSEAP